MLGGVPNKNRKEAQPNTVHPRKNARFDPLDNSAPMVVADSVTTAKANAPANAAARPTAITRMRPINRKIVNLSFKELLPRPCL